MTRYVRPVLGYDCFLKQETLYSLHFDNNRIKLRTKASAATSCEGYALDCVLQHKDLFFLIHLTACFAGGPSPTDLTPLVFKHVFAEVFKALENKATQVTGFLFQILKNGRYPKK